jgi:hypothetical protein
MKMNVDQNIQPLLKTENDRPLAAEGRDSILDKVDLVTVVDTVNSRTDLRFFV